MQCAVAQNTVEHSRLVKIPRECKGNVHLLSWGGGEMPKFAEAARREVKFFGVVTFDLVNDGAIQLGIRSCQVFQIPVGWYAVSMVCNWYAVSMVCNWYAIGMH